MLLKMEFFITYAHGHFCICTYGFIIIIIIIMKLVYGQSSNLIYTKNI